MKTITQLRLSSMLMAALVFGASVGQISAQDEASAFEDLGNGTFKHKPSGLIWLGSPTETPQLTNLEQAQEWVASLKDGMQGLSDGSEAGDWRLPTYEETVNAHDYDFGDGLFAAGFKNRSYLLTDGEFGFIAMWGGTAHGSGGSFGGMDSYRLGRSRVPLFIWPVRESED